MRRSCDSTKVAAMAAVTKDSTPKPSSTTNTEKIFDAVDVKRTIAQIGDATGQLEFEVVKQAEQLARLRHKVFGESSERRISPHPPSAEVPLSPAPKKGHGPTPQLRLPTREEHHRLADDQRTCPACNGTLEEMGEVTEDAEEVTVERRRFVVVKHRRHKYRCRCNAAVKTAPGPLRLIPGGRYSIDFAVALEIDKRLNHLPLDRQRRQMAREGLEISTQTMWDQENALAELLEPSYLKLLAYILGADVLGADETHWRLMELGSSKKWWVWCLTTHDAAWYMLEPSRSAETIRGVLGDQVNPKQAQRCWLVFYLTKGTPGIHLVVRDGGKRLRLNLGE